METFEHFFKPEVRSSGRSFITKDKVSLSQPSDTEIQSYVKASTAFKVTFKSPSVGSHELNVDCTCPQSKKGQFCKHIWAALVMINDKKSEFLLGKTELQKSLPQNDTQSAYKEKQADYRKLQYQKQKLRLKKMKMDKIKDLANPETQFPDFVEAALKYFSVNGFELRDNMTKDSVSFAMKKLARIFHPDMGGSHQEITELNRNADILTKFSPAD